MPHICFYPEKVRFLVAYSRLLFNLISLEETHYFHSLSPKSIISTLLINICKSIKPSTPITVTYNQYVLVEYITVTVKIYRLIVTMFSSSRGKKLSISRRQVVRNTNLALVLCMNRSSI